MNLCRCENGHFYDREKYAVCPHCANGLASDESVTEFYTEDPNGMMGMGGNPMPMGNGAMPYSPAMGMPMGQMAEPMMQSAPPMMNHYPEQPGAIPIQPIDATMPLMPENDITGEIPNMQASSAQPPVIDDDDDHTMAFMDELFSEVAGTVAPESAKNVSQGTVTRKPAVSAPCVGWLIAINGTHIGEDFRLITGRNFIGRGEDMDISLTGDKSVSRNRHAIVVYEPKKHLYLVQPGDSSSLVYHNDEVVLMPVPIKPYDKITVGEVDLIFMPLCNVNFNWNDILSEMQKN